MATASEFVQTLIRRCLYSDSIYDASSDWFLRLKLRNDSLKKTINKNYIILLYKHW